MVRINVHPSRLSNRPVHAAAATHGFDPRTELERMVSCCLLGENQFYLNGHDIAERIFELATQLPASDVAVIARNARVDLGLRHVPLLLLVALSNTKGNGEWIREAARSILRTPKDAMDLIALYWSKVPHGERKHAPLPYSFKQALRDGFDRWTEFQIRRYATLTNVSVRLRDLMILVHPKPREPVINLHWRSELFKSVVDNTVKAPDTWEALLSVPGADKREVWTHLLTERKLGALALIRNLSNMIGAGVSVDLVNEALDNCKASDVWPWQILAAAREAVIYTDPLNRLMIRSAGALPQIPGTTGVLVDVSGSMEAPLSQRSTMLRMDAAAGLSVILREVADIVLASFSIHLAMIDHREIRGATLANAIVNSQQHAGTNLGGAVDLFMRHSRGEDWVNDKWKHQGPLHRLVIITDEQSQSYMPPAIGIPVFIINLASYQRGLDFAGEVTRVNGWSGGVIRFLAQQIVGTVIGATDEED